MDVIKILKKIGINKTGRYENNFYIIDFEDSDDAAKAYSKLDNSTINTEYPNFESNSSKSLTKITNYFEIEVDDTNYMLFLISDLVNDKYYLKIGEK